MKTFQKVILGLLTAVVIVIGYFSFEFVHGYSSTSRADDVPKVEAKSVSKIINVALLALMPGRKKKMDVQIL